MSTEQQAGRSTSQWWHFDASYIDPDSKDVYEMLSSRYVGSAKELKKALNDKADYIVITDKKLAFAVRVIKSVTYAKLAIVATGAGVAAVGF